MKFLIQKILLLTTLTVLTGAAEAGNPPHLETDNSDAPPLLRPIPLSPASPSSPSTSGMQLDAMNATSKVGVKRPLAPEEPGPSNASAFETLAPETPSDLFLHLDVNDLFGEMNLENPSSRFNHHPNSPFRWVNVDDQDTGSQSETFSSQGSYRDTSEELVEKAFQPSFWQSLSLEGPAAWHEVLDDLTALHTAATSRNAEIKEDFCTLIFKIVSQNQQKRFDQIAQLQNQLQELREAAEVKLRKDFALNPEGFPRSWGALLKGAYCAMLNLATDAISEQTITNAFFEDGEYTPAHPLRSRGRVQDLLAAMTAHVNRAAAAIHQLSNHPAQGDLLKMVGGGQMYIQIITHVLSETSAFIQAECALQQRIIAGKSEFQKLQERALKAHSGEGDTFNALYQDETLATWLNNPEITSLEEYNEFLRLKTLIGHVTVWLEHLEYAINMSRAWPQYLAAPAAPENTGGQSTPYDSDYGSDESSDSSDNS